MSLPLPFALSVAAKRRSRRANGRPAHVVAWQPVLTDHVASTLEELGRLAASIRIIAGEREHGVRKAQGWTATTSLPIEVLPRRGGLAFAARVLRERPDAIHLFGSPFEDRRMMAALALGAAMRRRVYLVSEPYSPIAAGYFGDDGLRARVKAALRPGVYHAYGLALRGRVEGVFAISRLALEQYGAIGFAPGRLFPFGYFVPPATAPAPAAAPGDGAVPADGALRAVYVGSLIRRKGVDLLLAAARALRARGVAVTVDAYGSGDPAALPFDGEVGRYRGQIPFGAAQATIAGYDVLVLPSRYDGWGVVVNEALLAGVPVVCSDRVGAGAVVERWGCGRVFRAEDAGALADALADAADPARRRAMRAATEPAAAALSPARAARYMAAVFESADGAARPENPWYG